MLRKRNKIALFIFVGILALDMCAFAAKQKPLAIEINKRKAIELAQAFAQSQQFSDEFKIKKPAKISRQLAFAKPPYWVWQVYFPAQNESLLKVFKKSFLLIEVNATDGSIGEWGRR